MKRVAYIILATIAYCGCSRSGEGEQSSDGALNEIVLSPSVSEQVSSKGTIIEDITDLRSTTFMLYATAYDNDGDGVYAVAKAEIGYTSGAWSPTEGHKIYWPTSESDVTFYAWSPATVEPDYISEANLYFACDTKAAETSSGGVMTLHKDDASGDVVHYYDGAAALQEDLICSTTVMKNPTQQSVEGYGEIDYTVDLAFVHALTHLKFQYKTADGVEVRIKAMTLHNIISKGGFYSYSDDADEPYEWATYGDYYKDTRPNYHSVPMAWGNEDFVAATHTAVPINGKNDLMVFPQQVAAWNPDYIRDWDTNPGYSIANNDGFGSLYADMGAYLQIYCDMRTTHGADEHGDDVTYGESDTMTIDPDSDPVCCIYVPISSKDSDGKEVWVAGNIVTYTLTFGAGYDKDGEKNEDLTDSDDTPLTVEVTATLNGWYEGGDFDVEF
ncbi:MAG: fimbrillin family protein [Rikenellaceae bacterium]